MYKTDDNSPDIPNFYLPFGGNLEPKNRWVVYAKLIPWAAIEQEYKKKFKPKGAPAKRERRAARAQGRDRRRRAVPGGDGPATR